MIGLSRFRSPLFLLIPLVLALVSCGPGKEAKASKAYWDQLGLAKSALKNTLLKIPYREFPQTNGVVDLSKCTPEDLAAMSSSDQTTAKAWQDYADTLKNLSKESVDPIILSYSEAAENYARGQVTSYGLQDKLHQFILSDRTAFGGKKVTKENVAQINANIVEINRQGQEAMTFATKLDQERVKIDQTMNDTKTAMAAKYSNFK
jgi:hypothetical protein